MNRKFRLGVGCTHGYGDFQVEVLRGIFGADSREVAVKRIHNNEEYSNREGEELLRLLSLDGHHHENVLRFFHAEDHDYYKNTR